MDPPENICLSLKSPLQAIREAMSLEKEGGEHKLGIIDDEEPQWLRFFITPELLGSPRPLPVHLYKFLNREFSDMESDNISINSKNCVFPFRDGSLWRPVGSQNIPPAYAGMIKCDYALPKHLADTLMLAIQKSPLFTQGNFFAIQRKDISALNSYFLSFTRAAISAASEGDTGPRYLLDTMMGQVPGGSGSITLLGTSVKSNSSIIVHVDLGGVSVEEGLDREQTFSKAMLHQGGILTYRTRDASLVRFQITRNPWQLTGGGGWSLDLRPSLFRAQATRTPENTRPIL